MFIVFIQSPIFFRYNIQFYKFDVPMEYIGDDLIHDLGGNLNI